MQEVLVGKKPTWVYVLACVNAFNEEPEVVIKARGRAISHAVDVAQVATRTLSASVQSVQIGTEELENEGKVTRVSTIEIQLTK